MLYLGKAFSFAHIHFYSNWMSLNSSNSKEQIKFGCSHKVYYHEKMCCYIGKIRLNKLDIKMIWFLQIMKFHIHPWSGASCPVTYIFNRRYEVFPKFITFLRGVSGLTSIAIWNIDLWSRTYSSICLFNHSPPFNVTFV